MFFVTAEFRECRFVEIRTGRRCPSGLWRYCLDAPVMPRSARVPPAQVLPRGGLSHVSLTRAERDTLTARALRYRAMSAALVVIIVVALLCVAMLALFGILWGLAALQRR
jgi:hypothetical protein